MVLMTMWSNIINGFAWCGWCNKCWVVVEATLAHPQATPHHPPALVHHTVSLISTISTNHTPTTCHTSTPAPYHLLLNIPKSHTPTTTPHHLPLSSLAHRTTHHTAFCQTSHHTIVTPTPWLFASHVPSTMHHSSTTCGAHESNEQVFMYTKHATRHQCLANNTNSNQVLNLPCPAPSLFRHPFFCHLSATFVVMPLFHPITPLVPRVHPMFFAHSHAHHQTIAHHTTNHKQQQIVSGFHACLTGVLGVIMSSTLL